ncbi:NUDIX hydrolase [Lichenifustis flavocetrariae]|uniref:NUDIX hydrolase n=1 Tax=Lichenifustis flavocetrariae TaxID=2949735 RepID=A0AA42CN25_9HYPH|nr:NUDIX hydrolase [Lichenifustis flavocetrariae]MCW6508945.1 NUDIX hydrolase [Lichenifustis flavocetrariae]
MPDESLANIMWDGAAFTGAKIALLHESSLVAYLRDNKPSIPFPGLWDLPGGGREGDESPIACVCREVEEEFGIALDPATFLWTRRYPSQSESRPGSYFFVAPITSEQLAAVKFGSEGQRWVLMPICSFFEHAEVVGHFKDRLRDYLDRDEH